MSYTSPLSRQRNGVDIKRDVERGRKVTAAEWEWYKKELIKDQKRRDHVPLTNEEAEEAYQDHLAASGHLE